MEMNIAIESKSDLAFFEAASVKVKVDNLSVYYGKFKALADINMDIQEKKITAIIGPSGCGKSTLLRSFNRMNDLISSVHIEGMIKLDGDNIYGSNVDVVDIRRRIGMVFQRPNPFPKSIYDNVAYGPRLYGIHQRSLLDGLVENSLRQAALWDEVKDKLNQSGVSLSGRSAAAIMHRPCSGSSTGNNTYG